MVTRASRLLALDSHTNVTVVHADGGEGHPPGVPYDRLVAWAQALQAIPAAWTSRSTPTASSCQYCQGFRSRL
jgi:protein-L-isoaspartate O-methyltransferase